MNQTQGNLFERQERVIGSDDRIQVTNTSSFPYSAVVKLRIDFGSGGIFEGSGAMIGPNDVLTAGHNLWDPRFGHARSVTVIPGLAGTSQPFGSATSTRIRVPDEYVSTSGSFDYDIGVINLSSNLGNSSGWFNLRPTSTTAIADDFLNHSGYSADRTSGLYQYFAADYADFTRGNQVFYNGALDTFGGNSGGPLWQFDGGTRYIVGVHTSGTSTYNGGTVLTSDFHSRVVAWANDEGPTTGAMTGTDGSDIMTGTSGSDIMRGLDGRDTLSGGAGNDVIYGNQGTDLLFGQEGDDTLFGGQNNGPAGSDGVSRNGIDTLFGGAGNDVLYGNHGADVVFGEAGADTLYGGQDGDTMYGGDGDDRLFGNLGDDILYGDNETSSPGRGADTIDGGSGTDTAVFLNPMSTYSIVRQADGSLVVGGSDVLFSIELLRFSDTTVAAGFFL